MRAFSCLGLVSIAAVLGCSARTIEPIEVGGPPPLGPAGSVCLGLNCVNPDGNTHTECGCGADYCVPNERTVEFAGLTPLTCIKGGCQPNLPDSCPESYYCLEIPSFAIEWLDSEKGIQMPPYLCVPDEDDSETEPALSAQDEQWVAITGGAYRMGDATRSGRDVRLGDFEMLKSEATTGQYRRCVELGQCSAAGGGNGCTGGRAETDLPINCVSWHQARDLCRYLGGELPTESQWEYAARSEGASLFPWGEEPASCDRAVMQVDGGDACGMAGPQPVCGLPAGLSAQGLCDMVGNVWEWTLDDYQDDYSQIPPDGSAVIIEGSTKKVSRGGAYAYDADYQSAQYRNDHGEADYQVPTYGFRCVRE